MDEIDFLKDLDVLYHVSRSTKTNLVLLTQKTYWYNEIKDESIKSSLQPTHVNYREYSAEEIQEILKMRAEDGLYEWDEKAISLLAALIVKNHNSDARVGIKEVFKLGMENRWNESAVYEALKEASKGVEIEVIRGLRDRDLVILLTLINKKETNKAFTQALKNLEELDGSTISKTHFFRIINYLQNIGLLSLIKKRSGRYYTMEVQILLSDSSLVASELERRFG